MNSKKVIYYKDELNDEFSGAKITPRVIDINIHITFCGIFVLGFSKIY